MLMRYNPVSTRSHSIIIVTCKVSLPRTTESEVRFYLINV